VVGWTDWFYTEMSGNASKIILEPSNKGTTLMNTYTVLIHVDEIEKWKLSLANCRNLLNALHDSELTIEIVANSEAVQSLIKTQSDPEVEKALTALAEDKVIIVACNNALKSFGIDPKSLYDFVKVVPSGVAELTIKQHEGYAYIKL
jgi:intracellular sulfur oxidation DsrE/DsrF family protein